MKRVVLFIILFMLSACVSIPNPPGEIQFTESKVDGAKELRMEPAFCGDDNLVKLGVTRTSRMSDGDALLTVFVEGVYGIGTGESLIFNIDGEKTALKTEDVFTKFNEARYGKASSKSYRTTTEFLKKLNEGKKVHFQVISNDGKYLEVNYVSTSEHSAKLALPKFLTDLDKI